MSSLIMLSPAPLVELAGGEIVLDVRFVEGMKLHCQLWPGPVRVVMRRRPLPIDFPMRYAVAKLGFDLIVLDRGAPVPDLLLDEAAMIYAAADDLQYLDLPRRMRGRMGKLVFTVDESMSGRIAQSLAQTSSLRRRLGAVWWNLRNERALRAALRQADGTQFNGYPAWRAYRGCNPHHLRFFDSRIRAPMIVRAAEQEARAQALRRGDPLRLVWFGALTPESGAEDLLRMAHLLDSRRLPFSLEIRGDGELAPRLQAGIEALGLAGRVTLAPIPPFDPVLVPRLRKEADVFVSARRLSTPVSSYLEAMGCGLPVLGYGNAMWSRMQAESGGGWAVRRRPGALAAAVERLHAQREEVIEASARAADFARANAFETAFARRMNDLRDIAGVE